MAAEFSPPTPTEMLDAAALELARTQDADVYLYSGAILDQPAGWLIREIRAVRQRRRRAALILTTNGGSADAAFQIARNLQRRYPDGYLLYIFGYCKSAGTLMAVGAKRIIMSEFGQFGPLDVQFADKTELFGQTPALDIQQALKTLSNSAYDFFIKHFFELTPGGGVPTATAVEIAKTLTLGVIEPIAAQIDPLLLGRVERSMRIANEYSRRLDRNFQGIETLVSGYPSHEFVIDFDEAKTLFPNRVYEPDEAECRLEDLLRDSFNLVPYPAAKAVVLRLSKSEAEMVQPPNTQPDEHPPVDRDSAEAPGAGNGQKHASARRARN